LQTQTTRRMVASSRSAAKLRWNRLGRERSRVFALLIKAVICPVERV
jgi:hypothetical protein